MKTLELKKNFYWTGILDPNLKVFDIIMETKFGTTYNSYILKGSDKIALFETAKEKFMEEYLDKIKEIVDLKDIDYIIVDHTEPDHAGSAKYIIEENPAVKLVGSAAAINFMKDITNVDFDSIVVKNGDELSLGDKTLEFIDAQNLHWPDSMYTYVKEDKTLITCDSFGSHYSLDEVLQSKITNEADYMEALRYYYDNIIGPFKPFVLKAIDRIKLLDIDMICPGHGPVLDEDPWKIVKIYKDWSTEVNPNYKKTVVIPYVSAYGYTAMLAEAIVEGLNAAGDIDVKSYDLVTEPVDKILGDMYWADGILFGTPTILREALKPIWDLVTSIYTENYGGKFASAFGSYGWTGEGVPHIIERLKQLRFKVYGDGLRVKFKPNDAQLEDAFDFGYGFGKSVLAGKIVEEEKEPKHASGEGAWKCVVCGEIIEGDEPPEVCPVCGVGPEQFIYVETPKVTFTSSREDNYIIIGGGIAGLKAAEAIRARNTVANIEIISNEEVPCYYRPMLSKGILSDVDPINFYSEPKEWYEENNVQITLGETVKSIDKNKKEVVMASGVRKPYDKLVYATGAECNVPPIKGTDIKGVEVIRKLSDVEEIRKELPNVEDVVVIGGGVLGLEIAWQFRRAKKNVTILEAQERIMGRQLDIHGGAILRTAVEKTGTNVVTGFGIEEIIGNGKVSGVKTTDGTVHKAELVVISAGIVPNVALATEAGLDTGRFVNVNARMQTSDENIYACGDVAAFNGVSVGVWQQAEVMANVAGANVAGDNLEYKPITPYNAFEGFNAKVFSIGDVGTDPEKHYKALASSDESRGIYKKLYFLNGRFCGGILMGDTTQSALLIKAYEKEYTSKNSELVTIVTE